LLRKDGEREIRQVHGLDAERAFCHTGGSCVPWCGHEQGDVFTVAGNMLAGPDVIAAMSRAFREPASERRDLSERLLLALEAGQKAGGDKRGKQSAALLIHDREAYPLYDLRVDDHAEPLVELARLEAVARERWLHFRRFMPSGAQPSGLVDRGQLEEAIAKSIAEGFR
jgi:uncharacterized Ntn-hydrolase superfamily protein